MDSSKYQKLAVVTENRDFEKIRTRITAERAIRLLHGGIGLATESGEFLDALKKHIFYGKPIDVANLGEEMGDLFWYIAVICDELGADFKSIMQTNIDKLQARYGDKFSEHRATERNLDAEREILENAVTDFVAVRKEQLSEPKPGLVGETRALRLKDATDEWWVSKEEEQKPVEKLPESPAAKLLQKVWIGACQRCGSQSQRNFAKDTSIVIPESGEKITSIIKPCSQCLGDVVYMPPVE